MPRKKCYGLGLQLKKILFMFSSLVSLPSDSLSAKTHHVKFLFYYCLNHIMQDISNFFGFNIGVSLDFSEYTGKKE